MTANEKDQDKPVTDTEKTNQTEQLDQASADSGHHDSEENPEKTQDVDAKDAAEVVTEVEAEAAAEVVAEVMAEVEIEESPEAILANLQKQLADAEDKCMRAQAEAENIRKRAERDVEKAHKYALERCLSELLPVLDSLEQATTAISSHAHNKKDKDMESLQQGVEICYKLFLDVLGKFGVKQIDPVGERFNPEEQEAISMIPSADVEPGEVLEVFQRGYMLNERLVRAAKVLVAKLADEPNAKKLKK